MGLAPDAVAGAAERSLQPDPPDGHMAAGAHASRDEHRLRDGAIRVGDITITVADSDRPVKA